ncbi:MAG TPA: RES family NAD+ phosphorylase [Pseudobdellovibrionaceae bacterium]|nr:RES family NAD+ phosphorylase [Pseudobdellovibrionaceae bacterium]
MAKSSRKKVIKKSLQVKSKKSGITHQIDDFDGFEKLAKSVLEKFKTDNQLQLAQSIKFQEAIRAVSLDARYLTSYSELEVYRICFDGLSPLSIAGSLACGGRFNVGGSQISTHFAYDMAACIYVASSINCAKAETGPHRNSEIYQLSLLKSVKLWDVKSLLSAQENCEYLIAAIDKSPFNTQWSLQKFPTPSQILGSALRAVGGDGILYPSTKCKGGVVFGFFVKDEADANAKLKANRIIDAQLELTVQMQGAP